MTEIPESARHAARHGPFFIVFNAASGNREAEEEKQTIRRVLQQGAREFEFLQCEPNESLETLAVRAVARATARQGVVVAAGGDGTISTVAHAALGSACPFGVLPQGTFNYFAREHGVSQDTGQATRALLSGLLAPVQVGQVNGRLFLVNASVGLYPQILENREAWKQQLGRSRFVALLSGIATLLQSRRQLQLRIESGGQAVLLRTPTLFVGNNRLQLTQAGMAAPQVEALAGGQLAAVAVRPIGTLALLGLLVRGLLGRLGDAENIRSFSIRRLTVSPKASRRPRRIKVALDGEIAWMPMPLVFEVAAQPLLLLVPSPAERAALA